MRQVRFDGQTIASQASPDSPGGPKVAAARVRACPYPARDLVLRGPAEPMRRQEEEDAISQAPLFSVSREENNCSSALLKFWQFLVRAVKRRRSGEFAPIADTPALVCAAVRK